MTPPLKRFSQSDSLPSGHPIKGKSLRDGYAALDWAPASGKSLCL
jgi:hypothetical protein